MAIEPLSEGFPTAPPREKLTVSWLVEETIRFYREHFVSILTVFILANLVTLTVQYYWGIQATGMFEKNNISIPGLIENPEQSAEKLLPLLPTFLLLLSTMMIALYLITIVFHSMAIVYVYDHLVGGSPTWPESLGRSLPALPRLIGATLIGGIIVALGFLAFIIPGIFLLLMFVLAPQAVVIEGLGPISALTRSSEITRGNRLTIFLFFAFWVVVLLLIYTVLGVARPGSWLEAAQLLLSSLFAPILPISTTLIYHEQVADSQQRRIP